MHAVTRRTLLAAAASAYAAPPRAHAAEKTCLGTLLARRHMIRKFKPDPVPDAAVRRLIDAATRAPSAGHTEPWSFVVVRDESTRRQLARAALSQMFVAEAPVVIVPCAELSRSRARYKARGDRYALIDVSFASMLLLLAVTEAGLGACFVGAMDDGEVARILGLPENVQPLAVVPIGVPAEKPRRLGRRKLDQVIRNGRW
ncbi:MAG: nitroreductase family protein [Candidatus Binatia bacterium]